MSKQPKQSETNRFYKEIQSLAEEIEALRDLAKEAETLRGAYAQTVADLALVWGKMEEYYGKAEAMANAKGDELTKLRLAFLYENRVRTISGDEGLTLTKFMRIRQHLEAKKLIPKTND